MNPAYRVEIRDFITLPFHGMGIQARVSTRAGITKSNFEEDAMKRIFFVLFIVVMTFFLMPGVVSAEDVRIPEPGDDGYTFLYSVNTDLSYGPWQSNDSHWATQYSRSQLAASVKGFPSKTMGNSDIYFMPEAHLTAIVYYNDKGLSTVILLIPDKAVPIPDESSE